jgi:hypothetical protein
MQISKPSSENSSFYTNQYIVEHYVQSRKHYPTSASLVSVGPDLCQYILSYMDSHDFHKLVYVCKDFNQWIVKAIWKRIRLHVQIDDDDDYANIMKLTSRVGECELDSELPRVDLIEDLSLTITTGRDVDIVLQPLQGMRKIKRFYFDLDQYPTPQGPTSLKNFESVVFNNVQTLKEVIFFCDVRFQFSTKFLEMLTDCSLQSFSLQLLSSYGLQMVLDHLPSLLVCLELGIFDSTPCHVDFSKVKSVNLKSLTLSGIFLGQAEFICLSSILSQQLLFSITHVEFGDLSKRQSFLMLKDGKLWLQSDDLWASIRFLKYFPSVEILYLRLVKNQETSLVLLQLEPFPNLLHITVQIQGSLEYNHFVVNQILAKFPSLQGVVLTNGTETFVWPANESQ